MSDVEGGSGLEKILTIMDQIFVGSVRIETPQLQALAFSFPIEALEDRIECNKFAEYLVSSLLSSSFYPSLTASDKVALLALSMSNRATTRFGTDVTLQIDEAIIQYAESHLTALKSWVERHRCARDKRATEKEALLVTLVISASLNRLIPYMQTCDYAQIQRFDRSCNLRNLLPTIPPLTEFSTTLGLVKLMLKLASVYPAFATGCYQEAIQLGLESIESFKELGPRGEELVPDFVGQIRLTLSFLYRLRNDFAAAVDQAKAGISEFQRIGQPAEVVRAWGAMAKTLRAAGDIRGEIAAHVSALRLAQELKLHLVCAMILRWLAAAYLQAGELIQAREAVENSKAICAALPEKQLRQFAARQVDAIGADLLYWTDGWKEFISDQPGVNETGLNHVADRNDRVAKATALKSELASIYWESANSSHDLVLAVEKSRSLGQLYDELEMFIDEALAYQYCARLLRRLNNMQGAKEALLSGVNAWQHFRQRASRRVLSPVALEIESANLYRIANDLVELGCVGEAWQVLQRGKAVFLSDILEVTEAGKDALGAIDSDLRQKLVQHLAPAIESESSPASNDRVNGKNFEETLRKIANRSTRPAASSIDRGQGLKLEEYQSVADTLEKDAVILEYLKLDQRIQVFISFPGSRAPETMSWIIPDKLAEDIYMTTWSWRDLAANSYSNASLRKIVQSMEQPLQIPSMQSVKEARQQLRHIWNFFIGPIWERIAHARRIYLSPHQWLHHVPIHRAMSTEGRHLHNYCEVRYVPSASLAAKLRCAKGTKRSTGVPLRSSVFSVANPERQRSGDNAKSRSLTFSEYEANEVSNRLAAADADSTMLRGAEASLSAVLSAIGGHDVIHFSCHGDTVEGLPVLNHLRLSSDVLMAHDLLCCPDRLRPEALVILNACGTNEASIRRSDETLGLASAFLAKGARNVLATLWPINDLASSVIASRAIQKYVLNGRSIDMALADGLSEVASLSWDDAIGICDTHAIWCRDSGLSDEAEAAKAFSSRLKNAKGQGNVTPTPFMHESFLAPFQIVGV
ncbi:MAG: CHAT domain-containing protein [Phycisphaerae bacterium]